VRQAAIWMLRLIDVRSAVEARGFPASVEVSVQLELADNVLPANAGRWRLEVGDGCGKMARIGPIDLNGTEGYDPVVRLGSRGLAALYAGVPLGTLRRAGLAQGGDQATDAGLDSAFGGRPAFMVHAF